ncbi:MAG: hypothetical protein U0Z26_16080 [Anaerolineales bacterium]
MKTITRIIIILSAFIVLAGLMVTAVNASGMNTPGSGRSEFRPGGDNNGPRPEGGENRERGGGSSISRLGFGLIKNTIVIGILVAVIVIPKDMAKKRKKNSGSIKSPPSEKNK